MHSFLRRSTCVLLLLALVLSLTPIIGAAEDTAQAHTGTVITVQNDAGQPLTNAIVYVTSLAGTEPAVNRGDGTYFFKAPDVDESIRLHVTCEGYYAQIFRDVSPDITGMTVTLESSAGASWYTFDVFYAVNGTLPDDYCAPGANQSAYGPSGNGNPLVVVNIDLERLKEYTDILTYKEDVSYGSWFSKTTNNFEYRPIDKGTGEAARIAACQLFWDAVKECMAFESEQAFRATGLYDTYIAYSLKEEAGNWWGEDSTHLDGILDVDPPVYIIEMKYDGTYFGGFVTDLRTEVKGYPTTDDILQAYEDHLDQQISWTKNSGNNPSYTGSFVQDKMQYTVTVAQTNYAASNTFPETSQIGYKDNGDNYYLATFNMTLDQSQQVKFTVTYTDGLEWETVFNDQVQTAENGAAVEPFNGNPHREGYVFKGWRLEGSETLLSNEQVQAMSVQNADLVFVAEYIPLYTVAFHTNLVGINENIFRAYYPAGAQLTQDGYSFHLDDTNTVDSFYDIPNLGQYHNSYIFKGWYLDQDNDNDSRPISWEDVYTQDTDIYAHWIEVGTVAQENDEKVGIENGAYAGFDLVGTQIRYATTDEGYYDYTENQTGANAGLRYIAVLSENVWQQLLGVHGDNPGSAQYGIVMAKTTTADKYRQNSGETSYQLLCKDKEANGIDTTATYKYVKNLVCTSTYGETYTGSGIVADHFNGENYRLYTAVLTFTSYTSPEALAAAYDVEYVARAYLRYTDANGLLRIYYNNYNEDTAVYNSCSASYNEVLQLTQAVKEAN